MKDPILEQRMNKSLSKIKKDIMRKTEKNLLQLRKERIDDYIMSKRFAAFSDSANLQYQINPRMLIIPPEMKLDIETLMENFDIGLIWDYLLSNETQILKYGLINLRKFISSENKAYIKKEQCDKVVSNGGVLIDRLCSLLNYPDIQIKYESSWILINIPFYSQLAEQHMYTEKNLTFLIEFFHTADEVLIENAIWLLSNSCSDSQFIRQFFVSENLIEQISKIFEAIDSSPSIKEKCVRFFCNMCRGIVYEYASAFIEVIPSLVQFMMSTIDFTELKMCLFSLFKLTSTTSKVIEAIIDTGICKILIDIMYKYEKIADYYVVKIIANLASSDDVQTQRLINEGIITFYRQLLEENDPKILREIVWGVSNISAGTCSQVECLHENGLLIKILEVANNSYRRINEDVIFRDIFRESVYALANAIVGSMDRIKIDLLQHQEVNLSVLLYTAIELYIKDINLIEIIIHSIKEILMLEEENLVNFPYSIKTILINCGLEQTLENLLDFPSEKVKGIARLLIDNMS